MKAKIKISPRVIRETRSVCPVCLKSRPAVIVRRGSERFLEKSCPEHGFFSTVVWRGEDPSYEDWGANYSPPALNESYIPDCPAGCGLCQGHLQKTCCALVEVTSRCDLRCPVCFAGSGAASAEPDLEELRSRFQELVGNGNTFIQLSGGEPTERGDLLEIVAAAKDAGCENIQLNTNGLRLGKDKQYAKALREAGLSFVFMQFDGTNDAIHMKLRGRPLNREKIAAIESCADAFLGVTLVPTLAPGVNDNNIGEIIDFGFSNSPAVRGVHFQPISYFGRYHCAPSNADRITLPEVLRAIEAQTGGKLSVNDFAPSRCDHPYCGFHGDFVVLPKKAIMKLTTNNSAPCCGDDAHLKNRRFVARRWNRSEEGGTDSAESGGGGTLNGGTDSSDSGGRRTINGGTDSAESGGGGTLNGGTDSGYSGDADSDFTELNAFAKRIKSHGFTITAMAFQDAWNLDAGRLRNCSLHVSERGRLIPFCAKYLSAAPSGGE